MKLRCLLLGLTALLLWNGNSAYALSNAQAGYALMKIAGDNCEKNLQAIYAALTAYAKKHDGALPAANNLKGLCQLADCGLDSKMLFCSSGKGKAAKSWKKFEAKNCSYLYFGGFNLTQALKKTPRLPLVCDCFDNQHLMVLLANGEIQTIDISRKKDKITSCKMLIERLNTVYNYPAQLLEALRLKAAAMDSEN